MNSNPNIEVLRNWHKENEELIEKLTENIDNLKTQNDKLLAIIHNEIDLSAKVLQEPLKDEEIRKMLKERKKVTSQNAL